MLCFAFSTRTPPHPILSAHSACNASIQQVHTSALSAQPPTHPSAPAPHPQREDLLRMERLLLDQIDWRVQVPTTYAFLHLFTQVSPASSHACVYTWLHLQNASSIRLQPCFCRDCVIFRHRMPVCFPHGCSAHSCAPGTRKHPPHIHTHTHTLLWLGHRHAPPSHMHINTCAHMHTPKARMQLYILLLYTSLPLSSPLHTSLPLPHSTPSSSSP